MPFKSITVNFGNLHVYESNEANTRSLLAGEKNVNLYTLPAINCK